MLRIVGGNSDSRLLARLKQGRDTEIAPTEFIAILDRECNTRDTTQVAIRRSLRM